jgi:hypothetical protein
VDFVPNGENVMIGLDNAKPNTPESQVDEAHSQVDEAHTAGSITTGRTYASLVSVGVCPFTADNKRLMTVWGFKMH